ncbi:MAG: ABC transporter permease [Candidatus Bipolaricaulota bacterium]|nr:ABC transporter permease [Candidatus Bipolaricaulota bacterium]
MTEKKKLQKKRKNLPRLTFILSLIFPGLGHFNEGKVKAGILLTSFTAVQIVILVVGLLNNRMAWFGGALDKIIASWASLLFILVFWVLSYVGIRRSYLKRESGGYWTRAARGFMRHKKGLVGAFIVVLVVWAALFAPLIAPYKPMKMDLMHTVTSPGGGGHPLGTDNFGRDILSRIIYGSRVALGVGGGATLLNMVFGGLLGLLGGYYKGIIDSTLMRFLEVLNSIPYIIFALLVLSVFGAGVMQIIIVLGIYGLQAARIIRSEVLSVREEDYIMACEATGAGDFRKLFNHIFPNSMASLLVVTTMRIGINIIVVAGLSFLGFGVKPPTPSWGAMLQSAQSYMTVAWWMAVFPGLAIVLTVFGFNLLGDSLRDVLDPKMSASGR